MNNIVFFSRSRLCDLYGPLSKLLNDQFKCIHISYSDKEEQRLNKVYSVTSDYNFKKYVKENFSLGQNDSIEKIDEFIIKYSDSRFNLNGVIQSDRTLRHLSQKEAYSLIITYYDFWADFFQNNQPIIFFHESTSLSFNFLASLFCSQHNCVYTDLVGVPFSKPAFKFISSSNGQSLAFDKVNDGKQANIKAFRHYLDNKYKTISNLTSSVEVAKNILILTKNLIRRLINVFTGNINRLVDCTEWFIIHDNRQLKRILNGTLYHFLKWDKPHPEDVYYYYSMNLEPEAVIQYLADGYYSNQVKLIENIAAQMPPGFTLYVKDHVVEYGYRDYKDYKYLMTLHNVKVIDPRIPGSILIKNCQAVVAICGTAIIEAHFFNKRSYMFGNFYYCKSENVKQIKHVKNLKEAFYTEKPYDVVEGEMFLEKYLNSIYLGEPDYFSGGSSSVDMDSDNLAYQKNIFEISESIRAYVDVVVSKK